jgi:hypothetical protein
MEGIGGRGLAGFEYEMRKNAKATLTNSRMHNI